VLRCYRNILKEFVYKEIFISFKINLIGARMTKFEYCSIRYMSNPIAPNISYKSTIIYPNGNIVEKINEEITITLNKLGNENWELVSSHVTATIPIHYFILKRKQIELM
jgi:hypothetical protein